MSPFTQLILSSPTSFRALPHLSLSLCILVSGFSLGLIGCHNTRQLQSHIDEGQRERDVLRIAYEAQQLRIKELESRLALLEDQLENTQRGSRRQLSLKTLPIVKLNELSHSSVRSSIKPKVKRSSSSSRLLPQKRPPPSKQKHSPSSISSNTLDPNIPTLTEVNINKYNPIDRKPKRKPSRRGPVAPPENAAYAPDLSVVPLPPSRRPRGTTVSRETQPSLKAKAKASDSLSIPSSSSSVLLPSTSSLSKSSSSDPQLIDPAAQLLNRADALRRAREWTKAQHTYEQHLSLYPTSSVRVNVLYGLAISLKAQGEFTKSVDQLRRLIHQYPTNNRVSDALFMIGLIQLQQGDKRNGVATLTRLTRLYPNTSASQRALQQLKPSN